MKAYVFHFLFQFLSADINISSFGSDSVNTTLLATAKDEEDNAVIIKCANRYTNVGVNSTAN